MSDAPALPVTRANRLKPPPGREKIQLDGGLTFADENDRDAFIEELGGVAVSLVPISGVAARFALPDTTPLRTLVQDVGRKQFGRLYFAAATGGNYVKDLTGYGGGATDGDSVYLASPDGSQYVIIYNDTGDFAAGVFGPPDDVVTFSYGVTITNGMTADQVRDAFLAGFLAAAVDHDWLTASANDSEPGRLDYTTTTVVQFLSGAGDMCSPTMSLLGEVDVGPITGGYFGGLETYAVLPTGNIYCLIDQAEIDNAVGWAPIAQIQGALDRLTAVEGRLNNEFNVWLAGATGTKTDAFAYDTDWHIKFNNGYKGFDGINGTVMLPFSDARTLLIAGRFFLQGGKLPARVKVRVQGSNDNGSTWYEILTLCDATGSAPAFVGMIKNSLRASPGTPVKLRFVFTASQQLQGSFSGSTYNVPVFDAGTIQLHADGEVKVFILKTDP